MQKIKLINISKKFKSKQALKQVNLEFDRNKIMCALPLYLLSNNEKPNWQSVYICPLADICERLDEVVERANGYK